VHHDLPHVPWFALREVYETSRQQYIERSGGFLVKGYGEWLRRYAFAPVAHPVHGGLSSQRTLSFRASRTPGIRIRLLRRHRHRYRQALSNAVPAELGEATILIADAPPIGKHTTRATTVVSETY
jgi:hypothetical protein